MQSGIETLVKLILVTLLVLAGLAVWLLPKTHLVRGRRIGEKAFAATCLVGIVCGAAGLIVTFVWPQWVVEWHLWELATMPVVIAYVWWFVVARAARKQDVLDEKQERDMVYAGNFTLGVSVVAMGAAFILRDAVHFDHALWFPYYLFVVLLVYSSATLYLFKRR